MAFDITSASEKMTALQEQMKKLREEANAAGKAAFTEACKSLFAEHPELEAFKWAQFTAYFNDGDPCTFGVRDVYMKLKGREEEDDGYEDDDGFIETDAYGYKIVDGKYEKFPRTDLVGLISKDVLAVHGLLDEEAFLELFGDHVEVTVTADGVDTNDYSHD